MYASLYKEIKCPVQTPSRYYFFAIFISKQFPTLLAIREIIADALLFSLKNHTGASAEALYQEVAKTSVLPWQRRVTTISQYLPAKIIRIY